MANLDLEVKDTYQKWVKDLRQDCHCHTVHVTAAVLTLAQAMRALAVQLTPPIKVDTKK